MYLTFVILAAVGVLLAALSALTALVRSIAERRSQGVLITVGLRSRR